METKTNISNWQLGKEFEDLTAKLITKHFNKQFAPQKSIPIGQPAKLHKFDFVSEDNSIVCECKCFTWTKSNNNPSAKIATLNEAVLYLINLDAGVKKYIALKKVINPKTQETFANYYLRFNNHLLRDVKIIEVDNESETLKILN